MDSSRDSGRYEGVYDGRFVKVSSLEEQLKLLEQFKEIVVDERTLVVKAANAHIPKET
jgi:hypothetical protein